MKNNQSRFSFCREKMILFILVLFVAIYLYINRTQNYWAKRNVKHETPIPLFGNHLKNFFGLKSMVCISSDLYNKYPNEKVVGYFRGPTPELVIRDPEIARNILNVDFAYFYPRGLQRNEKKELLLKNLFHNDGDSWKLLRQRLTPAFTTAKLKAMFPLIISCAEKLQRLGEELVAKGGDRDVRELMARFSTEFIGACGFGIEMDTINNENSIFRRVGKRMFDRSFKEVFLQGLWDIFPQLRNTLRLMDIKVEKTLADISIKIFKQRKYKPCGRNDFVDLLLELAANGKIVGESIEHRNPDGSPKQAEMDMDLQCLVAQVFVFFAAGFETSSSATSYTLHELAFNPEVQIKIQKEIDQVLSKYDNKLCYDAVAEMCLLDMALKEALRIFPPLGNLQRVCASKYTISQLGITLDPGVKIIIPIQAIQNDEQYFPNPSAFRPDRFTVDEVNNRPKYVYLPFGEGPRACIDLIIKVFKQRNFKPSGRNDFVDLLLELAANGRITGDSIEHREVDGSPKQVELEMDLNCLVAQVLVFFAAGFETSSSATSFTLHQLAFNPEIQSRIQNEIDQVLSKYNNKLCYDAITEMTLLDLAFKESLRLFPSLGFLQRTCAKRYTIEQLGLTIDPGVRIFIPIQAIQTDEKYFDNPDQFIPERVTKEKDIKRQKYVYLPFGEGPRSCIGARLGQMQSLAGLAAILHKFSVEPGEKTTRKLRLNHRLNVVQGVVGGIPLRLKLRNK